MNSDDRLFSRGPTRRPLPRVADPLLQWSTGLTTKERQIYSGWLCEAGRNGALDEAMEEAGFSQVTIKHSGGNFVTHWAIETANLFVVAEGVQSLSEMKHSPDRFGITFAWRTLEGGRQQSQMRFRAFLHELLDVGFCEPLLVTAKSTLTGDLTTALMRQYDVLDAIDAFRAADQRPPLKPPFYACSIPLGPGTDVARGSAQTKEISPIVANIPNPITKDYIRAHWIKSEWVALIEGLLDETIAWSVATSKLLAAGEERSGQNGGEGDE